MKISRIALEEFRKFRQPLSLDNLQDGLNLFVGPNEAGKSTIAAAIRAAFLERYSTSKVAEVSQGRLIQSSGCSCSTWPRLGGSCSSSHTQGMSKADTTHSDHRGETLWEELGETLGAALMVHPWCGAGRRS